MITDFIAGINDLSSGKELDQIDAKLFSLVHFVYHIVCTFSVSQNMPNGSSLYNLPGDLMIYICRRDSKTLKEKITIVV